MWLPMQLPSIAGEVRRAGFQGDPAQLADVTRPPLAAVVKVGGATGAFVSDKGLIVTNHHVAFGVIQYNSSKARDLIDQGFVAPDMAGELPANPDFRVLVTTGFDNITDRILKDARGKSGRAYFDAVEAASKAEVRACEAEPGYRCSVVNMYYGTDFYRVRQLELKDIRLVYAPPRDIGNYGDEIDNFMWPRHSGDFTFLRAYVGKDGKPAAHSRDNVPYVPPAHLRVSTAALKAGDYAMLAGYPGITFRHRSAAEFAQQVEWQLPSRIELYGSLLKEIARAAPEGSDAAVKYASQAQSFKNTLKRAQGELEGLKRSDAVRARREDEAAMLDWLGRQPNAKATQADIARVRRLLDETAATRERDQLFSAMRGVTQLLRSAISLQRLGIERGKPDAQRESGYQRRDEALIEGQLKQVQRRYAPEVEKAILADLLRRYYALPEDQRIVELDAVFGADAAASVEALDALYAGTKLGEEAERLRWLRADAKVARSDDPLLKAAAALMPAILRIDNAAKTRDGELLRLRPAYMRALIGHRKSQGRAVYPDANSTLRVSYGKVEGMRPRDGVDYTPLTTVGGILEKHTGRDPFDAPEALREAIVRGDFGNTADPALGTQTVNFLTNLDTTGGNSGSPVMDAQGRLIGINFDSNWESVSASWMFDPRYKRAVHVDARYMRWLMDKVYPAHWLLDEMKLPKSAR
ncbi:S46 family peptidase [Lysobacter pythonis]|uniref:Dipeptidyl-peptidase n=2 Tax=Solilutibacter pythonis TaxID=2483112 RepID=A0A3M2I582_9GAMM|nr:S46 family peptidase [Lysobacter pythonis]